MDSNIRRGVPWLIACGVVIGLLTACNRADRNALPEPSAGPVVEPVDAAPLERGSVPIRSEQAPVATARSAQELYTSCRDRVEGQNASGECKTDADCQRAGCSQELCISTREAADGPMSTCEVRPCFAVLSACGCTDSVCVWSPGE